MTKQELLDYIEEYAWNYGRFWHTGSHGKIAGNIEERMLKPEEALDDIQVVRLTNEGRQRILDRINQNRFSSDHDTEEKMSKALREYYESEIEFLKKLIREMLRG